MIKSQYCSRPQIYDSRSNIYSCYIKCIENLLLVEDTPRSFWSFRENSKLTLDKTRHNLQTPSKIEEKLDESLEDAFSGFQFPKSGYTIAFWLRVEEFVGEILCGNSISLYFRRNSNSLQLLVILM